MGKISFRYLLTNVSDMRFLGASLLSTSTFLLLILPVNADTRTWKLKRDKTGIKIYQQATNSGYALTRGSIDIEASLDLLLSIMGDTNNCSRWVYACKYSQVVNQYNEQQRLDYKVIDAPLWFADRDMYIYSTASFDYKNKTFFIRLEGREKHDTGKKGRVRIKNLRGNWRLQQLQSSKTAVSYQIHANPQLPPSAILDAYMAESVFQTLNNLRELVTQ